MNTWMLTSPITIPSARNLRGKDEKITSSPPDISLAKNGAFTKEEYNRIVREKRSKFVTEQFGDKLTDLFKQLREDAEQRKPCHREWSIDLPDHFDAATVETIMTSYFSDLGYRVLTEPRKETSSRISFTLT